MIRHGETEANAAQRMAGSHDSPLTPKGLEQAALARDVMKHINQKPVAVFHSHLSRARDTAHVINEAINAPTFEDPDLAEMHAGNLEGAPYEECRHIFTEWLEVPNGEHPNDFFNRVKRGKSRALEQFNDPILIVCHGGVMRAFGAIYGLNVPGRFANAHLYEFIPNEHKEKFPWDVFDYRLEINKNENTPKIIKSKSDIFPSEI